MADAEMEEGELIEADEEISPSKREKERKRMDKHGSEEKRKSKHRHRVSKLVLRLYMEGLAALARECCVCLWWSPQIYLS